MRQVRGPVGVRTVVAAVLVQLIGFGMTAWLPWHGSGARHIDAVAAGCVAVAVAGFVMVTRWPGIGAGLVLAGLCTYIGLGYASGPVLAGLPVMLMLHGLLNPWRVSAFTGAGFVLGVSAATLLARGANGVAQSVSAIGWAGAAVLAAQAISARRQRTEDERRLREQQQQQTRVEERVRIAQDLHDGVGHALSLISIQARVARKYTPATSPATVALETIIATTQTALADMGGVLSALRDTDVPLRPHATFARVAEVVNDSRDGGQVVQLDLELSRPHHAAVQTAVVRLVQESLTNARKHAPGNQVTVVLTDINGLSLLVRNTTTGPPPSTPGTGLGIVGMRERVTATGGVLTVGPSGNGWEVHAQWPPSA